MSEPRRPRPRPDADGGSPRRPLPGPIRRPQPGRSHRARTTNRPALIAALLVVALGAAVVVVILVRRHTGSSSPAAAATASGSIAPQPIASLPIASPTATGSISTAEFTDASAVSGVLAAANTAVQTVDSYDYRHLAAAKVAGDKVSTGDFLTRFNTSLSGSIKASARSAKTVQQATVEKIGITSLSGNQATALAVGRLQVVDTAHPGGRTTPLTLGVTMQSDGGVWRISNMTDLGANGTLTAAPPGTPGLAAAVTAGARGVVDLLSYTRNNFTADLNRALDGLTGTLRAAQQAQASALKSAMLSGGFDYAGAVRAVGIESASGTSVLMLACATGSRLDNSGKVSASGTLRYEVGVTYTGGRWLVSEFVAAGFAMTRHGSHLGRLDPPVARPVRVGDRRAGGRADLRPRRHGSGRASRIGAARRACRCRRADGVADRVGTFVEYGTTSRAARWFGAGRTEDAINEGVQASWLAVGIGTILVLLGELFAGPLTGLLAGGSSATQHAAESWFRIGVIGLPGVLLVLAGNGWMRGVQRTREPVVIVIAANALSAVLCPLLVYPAGLGLQGSAIANLIAQTIGAGLFLRSLARAAHHVRPDRKVMRAQLVVGRDLIVRAAAFQVAFLTAAGVASRMGTAQIAAHQIGLQLWEFTALLLDSFAIAAQSLVGAALGGSDPSAARQMALQVSRWGLYAGVGFAAIYAAGWALIPHVFTSSGPCCTKRTCSGRGSSGCCRRPVSCSRSTAC